MSVFGNGITAGMGEVRMPQKCRRDYEAEIERVKKAREVTRSLLWATENYLDTVGYFHATERTFTLESLYGGLGLAIREQDRQIINLQKEWEAGNE